MSGAQPGAFQQLLGQTVDPPYLEIPEFQVIERSLFRPEDGYCGWVEHAATAGSPPLSLTRYPSLSGANALMISSGPGTASTHAGAPNAIKRLSRPRPEEGQLHWKVWWCWRSEQPAQNPRTIVFGIDTQLGDNSLRSETEVGWQRRETAEPYSVTNQMYLINNNRTVVNIPDCVWIFGENEDKPCWFTIESVYNYSPTVVMEYAEVIIQGVPYNVEGLAGRGKENPQVSSSFANGLNLGIKLNNRNNTGYGCAEMFVGRSEAWVVA